MVDLLSVVKKNGISAKITIYDKIIPHELNHISLISPVCLRKDMI